MSRVRVCAAVSLALDAWLVMRICLCMWVGVHGGCVHLAVCVCQRRCRLTCVRCLRERVWLWPVSACVGLSAWVCLCLSLCGFVCLRVRVRVSVCVCGVCLWVCGFVSVCVCVGVGLGDCADCCSHGCLRVCVYAWVCALRVRVQAVRAGTPRVRKPKSSTVETIETGCRRSAVGDESSERP